MLKNVTFSVEERDIEAARDRARDEHTSMNDLVRLWIGEYGRREDARKRALATIRRIQAYADTGGRKFTRDEMNER